MVRSQSVEKEIDTLTFVCYNCVRKHVDTEGHMVPLEEALIRIDELEKENAELRAELERYRSHAPLGRKLLWRL